MNIGQLCHRVIEVPQSTSLLEVARVMSTEHVGAVTVTDASHEQVPIAGIITDRDIVSAQLERSSHGNLRVRAEFKYLHHMGRC